MTFLLVLVILGAIGFAAFVAVGLLEASRAAHAEAPPRG
jgi:hypothetical protein